MNGLTISIISNWQLFTTLLYKLGKRVYGSKIRWPPLIIRQSARARIHVGRCRMQTHLEIPARPCYMSHKEYSYHNKLSEQRSRQANTSRRVVNRNADCSINQVCHPEGNPLHEGNSKLHLNSHTFPPLIILAKSLTNY